MKSLLKFVAASLVCAAGASAAGPITLAAGADPERGGQLYESRCGGCHSLDANRVGPLHRGLLGRPAGGVAGYVYSPAVKDAEVIWSDRTLDRWLTDPEAMIPGQRMNIRVTDPKDRAEIGRAHV